MIADFTSEAIISAHAPMTLYDGIGLDGFANYNNAVLNNIHIGCLVSPEISFYKSHKHQAGDSMQIVSCMHATTTTQYDSYDSHDMEGNIIKFNYTHPSVSNPYETNYLIDDSDILPVGWTNRHLLSNYVLANYCWRTTDNEPSFYHASSLFFTFASGNAPTNWDNSTGYKYYLANYVRQVVPYGGHTNAARTFSTYLPCTGVLTIVDSYVTVYGGDTFIDYFDCQIQPYDSSSIITSNPDNASCVVMYIPVESSINLSLRSDSCYHNFIDARRVNLMESPGVHQYLTQEKALYLYNTAYSKQSDTQVAIPKPLLQSANETFDHDIYASLTKESGEAIDKWTMFLPDNKVTVEGQHGSINALVDFDDKLLFFQDTAIVVVSVNAKILTTPDETGAALTIVKGGILDVFQYITRKFGFVSGGHLCVSGLNKDVVDFYVHINRTIMVYTYSGKYYAQNENKPLSIIAGVNSVLNDLYNDGYLTTSEIITGKGVSVQLYPYKRRILFTFANSDAEDKIITLGYNEIIQAFEGFYSMGSLLYLPIYNSLYSVNSVNTVYLNGVGNYGQFYSAYSQAMISVIFNALPNDVKALTNLSYNLHMYNSEDVDLPFTNFDSIRVYNDYQDTGIVTLSYGQNSRRRMRIWHVDVPRNLGTLERIKSQASIIELRFSYNNNLHFVMEKLTSMFTMRNL